MSELTGKVAVVTGASKGIGAAIAKALGAAGAAVVVNYASSKEGAERVVAEITSKGGKAIAVHGNVAEAKDVQRLFAETKKVFGALDVLVNNAGVFAFAPLEAVTESEFHREFNINVLGTILATKEALNYFEPWRRQRHQPQLRRERESSSQFGGLFGDQRVPSIQVTRVLAKELGAKNIRVNAIAPGGVDTEGVQRVGVKGSDFEKQMVAETPLGRFGQPEDIARVAVFLASDDAGWVTGERITVSGGYR